MTSSIEQREANRSSFTVAPPKALVSRVKVHRRRSLQTTRSPQEIANPAANAHHDPYGYSVEHSERDERPVVISRRMSLQPGGFRKAERRRSSVSSTASSVQSRRSSASSRRSSVQNGSPAQSHSTSSKQSKLNLGNERERDNSGHSRRLSLGDDESWNFEDDELSIWD